MRNAIELVDGERRATIKAASIDGVLCESGVTTVFFNGSWLITKQDYDEVVAIINKAEEAKGWQLRKRR